MSFCAEVRWPRQCPTRPTTEITMFSLVSPNTASILATMEDYAAAERFAKKWGEDIQVTTMGAPMNGANTIT